MSNYDFQLSPALVRVLKQCERRDGQLAAGSKRGLDRKESRRLDARSTRGMESR